MGPQVVSSVVATTGSYRLAGLSLIIFFIAHILILIFTDADRAVHDAGNPTPEEARAEA